MLDLASGLGLRLLWEGGVLPDVIANEKVGPHFELPALEPQVAKGLAVLETDMTMSGVYAGFVSQW